MRGIKIIILLTVLTFQVFAQGEIEAEILLGEMVSKKGNIGVTAGYMVKGEIKWKNSAGYLCNDDKTPFSDSTKTRVASISKSMTAVAIMQLVEKGLINLEKPIQTYLPEFPKKEKGEITVRQLLAHTSGISQYENDKEIENTVHYNSLEEAMEVFQDRPLIFEPGSKYFYTTYGYVVLGRIIELVSDLSYEEYMQKNIWEVADMTNTGVERIDKAYENKSCLYHKKKRKTQKAVQNDLSNRIPGGGLYSTLQDILKFGQAVLDGRLISESTLLLMLQSQPVEYKGNKYGLGWRFYGPEGYENVVIGHDGGQTGCTSQLFIVPKSKTIVVALSNTSGTYRDIATFASELVRISELEKN